MTKDQAVELIADADIGGQRPTTWADLGCGEGIFTLALATLLPKQSVIHAMDRDPNALRQIPDRWSGVSISTHVGDFLTAAWPFDHLDGILLANSLHYVRDQLPFI